MIHKTIKPTGRERPGVLLIPQSRRVSELCRALVVYVAAGTLLALSSACDAKGAQSGSESVYDRPAVDISDERAAEYIKAFEAQGKTLDALRYTRWALTAYQVKQGQTIDSTPDITPRTVRDALSEELERDRRRKRAGEIGSLKLSCQMMRENMKKADFLELSGPVEFGNQRYSDACAALAANNIAAQGSEEVERLERVRVANESADRANKERQKRSESEAAETIRAHAEESRRRQDEDIRLLDANRQQSLPPR